MSNLGQGLLWGALLSFLVMFFFLSDFKSPFLVGIIIPLSLVVTLLFFHLIGLSINIISLSGLILGVGMMIDNSIIVIDNITQHYERNCSKGVKSSMGLNIDASVSPNDNAFDINQEVSNVSEAKHQTQRIQYLFSACITGTNEVIRPMLSSVLTTCAVFIPLIFLKGISGALFYDQAIAITIGLFASLIVSITILPVYYLLLYKKGKGFGQSKLLSKLNVINYELAYEKGFRFTMRHQGVIWTMVILMLLGAFGIYQTLPKSKLPALEKDEMLIKIDWNEQIHVEENRLRTEAFVHQVLRFTKQHTCLIGEQQFMLDKTSNCNAAEAIIYIKV
jgi:multidrug efflux pump subunit AcrB